MAVRVTPRPLMNEDDTPTEPEMDLNRKMCSKRLEDEPKEPNSDLVKPLVPEPVRENDPVNDLNHEPCSCRLDDAPSEPLSG